MLRARKKVSRSAFGRRELTFEGWSLTDGDQLSGSGEFWFGAADGGGAAEAFGEFVDPSGGVDELLFTREERMAGSANADGNARDGGTSVINRATGAGDGRFDVLGMNLGLHGIGGC